MPLCGIRTPVAVVGHLRTPPKEAKAVGIISDDQMIHAATCVLPGPWYSAAPASRKDLQCETQSCAESCRETLSCSCGIRAAAHVSPARNIQSPSAPSPSPAHNPVMSRATISAQSADVDRALQARRFMPARSIDQPEPPSPYGCWTDLAQPQSARWASRPVSFKHSALRGALSPRRAQVRTRCNELSVSASNEVAAGQCTAVSAQSP